MLLLVYFNLYFNQASHSELILIYNSGPGKRQSLLEVLKINVKVKKK